MAQIDAVDLKVIGLKSDLGVEHVEAMAKSYDSGEYRPSCFALHARACSLGSTVKSTNTPHPKFLAVDFFCGAGGTTRGLLDAGGYVIAGIDKDRLCRETYERNNKNATLDGRMPTFLPLDMFPASTDYPEGQKNEVWDRLNTLIPYYRRVAPGLPLLFAICAPCQSFTRFIQRRMTPNRVMDRERDRSLLSQTLDFVEEFEPEMIVSENVANIERGTYRHIWEEFRDQLKKSYDTGGVKVCASRFGIPQFRRRSILLAVRRNDRGEQALFDLAVPTFDPDTKLSPSVRAAIGHLPSLKAGEKHDTVQNHACRNLKEINKNRLRSVKPGEPNWKFAETEYGDLSLDCHRRLEKRGKRGFGDVYTRMHPDRPSPTITTRFHSISNGRFGHYDEGQVRGLSLREGATIQSFPEDYVFYGNGMDTIAKMIGNAVPPKLSKFMAGVLLDMWRNRSALPIA